jgi:hypothetical protein
MALIDPAAIGLPERGELVAASALLAAIPDLGRSSSCAEEVALAEYGYYTTQTYLFETVGFQLLGEMAANLRHFDHVHALADQARDEAEHASAYRAVVARLPVRLTRDPFDAQAAPLHAAFVGKGRIEEKVVASYFVLESLAMGIFAARHRFYARSPLARLDHAILSDEAAHQAMGVELTASLVQDGRLSFADVLAIIREASATVSRILVPTPLFDRFSVGSTRAERELVLSSGFLDVQRATSQKAMQNAVRRLRRRLSEGSSVLNASAA